MIIKVQSNNPDRWHIYDEVSHLDYSKVDMDAALQPLYQPEYQPNGEALVIESKDIPCSTHGHNAVELWFDDYYKKPRHIITNCAVYLCTNHGKTIERLI